MKVVVMLSLYLIKILFIPHNNGVERGSMFCPEGTTTLARLKVLSDKGKIQKDAKTLLYNTRTVIKYTGAFNKSIEFDLPIITGPSEIEL